ncbi:hypothetical protein ACFVYJ_12460 [Pontibacter sp. JAM-7]|uniref:hypothetical protein n=1 Tax=Pontibacter sp. JAM-7 TaxID=3366581 RepID=UPI003AF816E7
MAGQFRGSRRGFKKAVANAGRGVMESVRTDGPFTEWVGMPPYYIHHLLIEGEEYSYLTAEKELEIPLGKKVAFRYKETSKGKMIEKRSLGVVIDPSELGY